MSEPTPSTLRVHMVQRLRKDILSGRYKPGDRLNESSIAREFGTSRIPVREALFELRESGLLMSHERRGMVVTSLSKEEILKINSVRLVLETEALTLARARMTPAIAATLRRLVEKMESSTTTLSEAVALDLKFHRTIWAAAGNDYIEKVLDPLAAVLFAQYTLERVSSEHRRWRLNHHRALLDALLSPKSNLKAAILTHMKAADAEKARTPEADRSVSPPAQRPSPKKMTAPSIQAGKEGKRAAAASASVKSGSRS